MCIIRSPSWLQVAITASSAGCMCVLVHTELATIRTFYKDLRLAPPGDDAEEEEEVEASGTVLIKKLLKVLQCQILQPAVVVGCIIEDHAFVV